MTDARSLRALLTERGTFEGRAQLADVWPAVQAWGLQVLDPDELLLMYAASRPPGMDGSFAGTPPDELDGEHLWCVMWWRDVFVRRGGGVRSTGSRRLPPAGAGRLTWWSRDFSAWPSFRASDDFIDAGPSTPHLDWPLEPPDREGGLAEWSDHALLRMARSVRAVGVTLVDDEGLDELVLIEGSPPVHRSTRF